MVDKETLIRNFSRYARTYDRYANIQAMVAYELISQMPCGGITNILEIGCGTGNYTNLLRERFKHARLKALDISKSMVEVARHKLQDSRIEFVIGDGEAVELTDKFDLITSNATFQWFENIESAMANYKDALTVDGLMTFSIFGPLTFWELNQSLREVLEDRLISSGNFLEKEELGKVLRAHFVKVSIKELMIKEEYPSLTGLLRKIKYTGTRGDSVNGSFLWKRHLLKRLEDVYKTKFGRIEASYQIFLCEGTMK